MGHIVTGGIAHPGLIGMPSGRPAAPRAVACDVFARPIAQAGGSVDRALDSDVFRHLSRTFALPCGFELVQTPALIAPKCREISLHFGQAAPNAARYFDRIRSKADICIWKDI